MNVIEVTDLQKHYGSRRAVDGVSFAVEEGEIFGILGPNGAGKTTTVESIAGLRDAGRRARSASSASTRGSDRDRLRTLVGVQLQESELPERMTVARGDRPVRLVLRRAGRPARLLEDLGLADQRDTAYRNLSGGQKQRLSIALALVGRPKVAILDELSTGLDPHARRETWRVIESIRDRGVTVLLVTHLMEEAERLADRVAVFRRRAGSSRSTRRPASSPGPTRSSGSASGRRSRSTTRLLDRPARGQARRAIGPDRRRHGHRQPPRGRDLASSPASRSSPTTCAIEQANLDDAFIALTGRAAARTTRELS